MADEVVVNNASPNNIADLTKVLADFNSTTKELVSSKKTMAEQKETMDNMKVDMAKLLATQEKERKDAAESKVVNDSTTKESLFGTGYEVKEVLTDAVTRNLSFGELLLTETENRHVKSIQSRASDCYLIGNLIAKYNGQLINQVLPTLGMYKTFMKDTENVRKAMSIGSGEAGFDWIPTGFSADLIEIFHLQMVIMKIHPQFNVPQKLGSWKVPGTSTDLKAFLTEAGASDNPTKFKVSTRATRNITFVPKKFTVATVFDLELEEDSIIPVLPNLKVNIVQAIVRASEDTIINGDIAGTMDNTDMHGDTINVQSPGKGWDGWRKFITNHGSVRTNAGGAASFDGMIQVMRNMGKYAINTGDLRWVTGPNGYFDGLLRIAKVQTVDLFGPQAIVQRGELARFMGIPIIVTEQERQDLKTTTGVSGGASSAYNDTSIQLVWRPGFTFGMKRKITVDSGQIRRTDSVEVWSTARMDFQANYTTGESIIGEITNVA